MATLAVAASLLLGGCKDSPAPVPQPSTEVRPAMVKHAVVAPPGSDMSVYVSDEADPQRLKSNRLLLAGSGLPQLRGTNLVGGEMSWGVSNTADPKENTDYLFVSHQDIDYLASKGFGFVRLLFSWEAIQPNGVNSAFPTSGNSGTYVTTFFDRVNYATSKGMYVMIEPHGGDSAKFARYKGNIIGSAQVPNAAFADLWSRLANQFKGNPKVMYGLMNEPNNISTTQWFQAAQAAVLGIRATGSTQLILVPGGGWTAAGSWTQSWYDTAVTKVSNASAFLTYIKDPLDNTAASVHMYYDADAGGATEDVVSSTIGVERLKVVIDWAKANNVKVHLGELATGNTAIGKNAVANTLQYANTNTGTLLGWAWWAYGPPSWWGGYRFALSPKSNYTIDSPFLDWLKSDLVPPTTAPPVASPTAPTNPITYTKGTVFTTNSGTTNWAIVPTGYDTTHMTPTPLLVWLHGCGGRAQYDVANVSGGIQAWISLAVGGREGTCWSSLATDGPKVLSAIADMKTHFNIDPRKVYLGGYSSGGDLGYPVLFQNAGMFAGAIFENTAPSTAALQASATAAWKVNIAHLAHTGDTTFPIAGVRSAISTLKLNGFPVTLIERPGNHWDNDTANSGTNYDLRTILLPYLAGGWVTPGPNPPAVTNVRPTLAFVESPGDQGFTSTKTILAGQGAPAGTYTLKAETRTTYGDNNTFCVNIAVYNTNTTVDIDWKEMTVDLRGHTLSSAWNSTVVGTTGVITIRPVDSTKTVLAGNKNSVGFCVARTTDKDKDHYQVLVKSLVW